MALLFSLFPCSPVCHLLLTNFGLRHSLIMRGADISKMYARSASGRGPNWNRRYDFISYYDQMMNPAQLSRLCVFGAVVACLSLGVSLWYVSCFFILNIVLCFLWVKLRLDYDCLAPPRYWGARVVLTWPISFWSCLSPVFSSYCSCASSNYRYPLLFGVFGNGRFGVYGGFSGLVWKWGLFFRVLSLPCPLSVFLVQKNR